MPGPSKIYHTLYIGDLSSAEDVDNLFDLGVTHVLSVGADVQEKDEDITYQSISILDMDDENILQHFEPSFKFIEKARNGGVCLVHCQAGVSRSAAICIAYIMKKFKISLEDATETVSDVRPQICPNDGFKVQLQRYYEILHPELKKAAEATKVEPKEATKIEELSIAPSGSEPKPVEVAAEEAQAEEEKKDMKEVVEEKTVYCCRMCRRPLFFAEDIMPHQVSKHNIAYRKRDKGNSVSADFVTCNSHFLQEPLQWMGNVDENEGKICCSKCQSRLGNWKWDGQQCSCGTWVTPALQIAKNRVDERTMPISTLVPA